MHEDAIDSDPEKKKTPNCSSPGPPKPKVRVQVRLVADSSSRRKRRISSNDGEVSPLTTKSGSTIKDGCSQVSLGQDDDPAAFGVLVAHKLRCLSTRNAMMAQSDIIAILHKYVLAEVDPS